jgi:uncharacterized protein
MNEAILISAAALGFAGSLHCVGMCGPIALSLPVNADYRSKRGLGVALYFAGKTTTYVLLGMLFGLLGQQLVIAGWQRGLSIVLGAAMLLFALLTIFKPAMFHTNKLSLWIGDKLSPLMGYFLKKPGASSSLIFGGLNGLLPCGLLYVALSAAVATGSVQSAAMFMLVFGISTMPLMLFLVLFSAQLSLQYRNTMRRWLPVFTAVVAVLLILRGLDLGIPYVSPHIESLPAASRGAEAVICH